MVDCFAPACAKLGCVVLPLFFAPNPTPILFFGFCMDLLTNGGDLGFYLCGEDLVVFEPIGLARKIVIFVSVLMTSAFWHWQRSATAPHCPALAAQHRAVAGMC